MPSLSVTPKTAGINQITDLAGRIAIVAGTSRGIGMGSAIELSAAGATVYALGRTLEPDSGDAKGSLLETVEAARTLGGHCVPIVCDCTDELALSAVFGQVRSDHGRIDVMVNSVFSASRFASTLGKRFWELPTSAWQGVIDLGARSAFLGSWYAAPLLIETAQMVDSTPLIVNVTGRGLYAIDTTRFTASESRRPSVKPGTSLST